MTQQEIQDYWDQKAETLKTDPAATMKDVLLRSMEIEAIGSRLKAGDELIDVGGGNAFAGIQWAEHCRHVTVVDYSQKMIAAARDAISASSRHNLSLIHI